MNLLIWDLDGAPQIKKNQKVLLWGEYQEKLNSNYISIFDIIDNNSIELRNKYVSWVNGLGEVKIKGKSLANHLLLRPDFSYWIMHNINQKFNISKYSEIDNVIKVLGLEIYLKKNNFKDIYFATQNNKLKKTLKSLEKIKLLDVSSNKYATQNKINIRQEFSNIGLNLFQAALYFCWSLLKYLRMIFFKKSSSSLKNSDILFIDTFTHLPKKAFDKNLFISNYWTNLVEMLRKLNLKSDWLHNYFYSSSLPSYNRALSLIENFNKNNFQNHFLTENYLNVKVFMKTLKDYFLLLRVTRSLNHLESFFSIEGSKINLWPLFKSDWFSSLYGKDAIKNCIYLNIYEEIFKSKHKYKVGVYLLENQPWEKALTYAWKSSGNGTIIGFPHTVVRFWDLRYCKGQLGESLKILHDKTAPDKIAVSSLMMRKHFSDDGFMSDSIEEVEALRFLHLLNYKNIQVMRGKKQSRKNILLLGDILERTNKIMLEWFTRLMPSLELGETLIYKPHPAYPLNTISLQNEKIKVSKKSFMELSSNIDLVISSNSTTAVFEAYYLGIPFIQIQDPKNLNYNPLMGQNNIQSVKSFEEFKNKLLNNCRSQNPPNNEFLFLDFKLNRWKDLIQKFL